jgi:hypothetical protein
LLKTLTKDYKIAVFVTVEAGDCTAVAAGVEKTEKTEMLASLWM